MTAPDAGPPDPVRALAISVVVPTHQRRALLLRVLEALGAQTLPRDRYEVVVVCDGCVDGTAEAARAWASARPAAGSFALSVLEQPNAGAAAARNRGARAATAPLFLF